MPHTSRSVCADVRSWLLHVTAENEHQIMPEWSEHVATCNHCRGALVLLASDLLTPPPPDETAAMCDTCQRDLAAYIDTIYARGHSQAARRFPQVWWHLWTCGECAETMRVTAALVEAEARGELPRPRIREFAHQTVLELSRTFLALVFGPQLALGTARGKGSHDLTFAASNTERQSLRLTVSDVSASTCCLSLLSDPPTLGRVVLRVGERVFQADLNERGEAHFRAFPLHLLQGADGPDMVITLES